MKFNVLGLGESIVRYEPDDCESIGVNDIWQHFPVDYLCVVDLPGRFSIERLNIICQSKPKKFYSQAQEWRPLVQNFQSIKMSPGRGSLDHLDDKSLVPHSVSSVFVACILAYKMGASELKLFGCDFNTHSNFIDSTLDRALNDFNNLNNEFKKRGVEMLVTKESKLSNFIKTF